MENENKILEEVQAVKKETNLEKHVQTILLSVITAVIIGGFLKINSISESLVRMEERERIKTEQISQMQQSVNKMQNDINDLRDRMTKFEFETKK